MTDKLRIVRRLEAEHDRYEPGVDQYGDELATPLWGATEEELTYGIGGLDYHTSWLRQAHIVWTVPHGTVGEAWSAALRNGNDCRHAWYLKRVPFAATYESANDRLGAYPDERVHGIPNWYSNAARDAACPRGTL